MLAHLIVLPFFGEGAPAPVESVTRDRTGGVEIRSAARPEIRARSRNEIRARSRVTIRTLR